MRKSHWDAGLTDEEGHLGRPIAWDKWWVPSPVNIERDRLVWGLSDGRLVHETDRLLEGFMPLAEATDGDICNYARRWGVFGICVHGLPASHYPRPEPLPNPLPSGERLPWCYPQGYWEGEPYELIEDWRGYSRKVSAIANVASRLHGGELGTREDWEVLNSTAGGGPTIPRTRSIAADQRGLCVVVNQLLRQAQVGVRYSWEHDRAILQFDGAGLFGALVVQLALAIGRTDGLAVCSGCGVSYVPRRRPRRDRRRYCEQCVRRGVPQRDAATDYRRRKGTGRR
jgi:hypothetical protein